MKKTLFICLSIIMLALVGCNKDKNTWGKLEEGSVTIAIGETVKLTFDDNGNKHPQWSSDDEFIATVTEKGEVTGMHVGKTTVYVNHLACEVIVIDEYIGYPLDEPFTNWSVNDSVVEKYELNQRGLAIADKTYEYICDTTIDSTTQKQVIDTLYFYVKVAEYDYSGSFEDIMVDYATYNYSYSKDKAGNFSTRLDNYDYRIVEDYEDDIEEILDNRYAKLESATGYEAGYTYNDINGKVCYIYIKIANGSKHLIFTQKK
ncbi:MAG: Ig-like domain-containing protein [Paludibacteraceae bacterium]|nr:Ig-like domain-containing protein [Paludibacteraceae bacterium]